MFLKSVMLAIPLSGLSKNCDSLYEMHRKYDGVEQDRLCAYNVTLRRVRVTIVVVGKQ